MSTDKNRDFIREAIDVDLENGRYDRVITRFPPEPNAHLHIGHGKAICINFGIAASYGGQCNLRYDDTNPTREEQEYVDSMQEDIRWLGFDWGPQPYYASDYFGQLYEWAVALIKKGLAYVDDQTADEIRENRGTLTEPGKNSPYRDRSIEENLDLFEQMKDGAFPDGSRVLRAKIDMAAPNINLRDPVMYRIMHTAHHRTGDAWCIYPMYDWAHGQSDAIEGVTHSLCSDEFTNNRPLYDWFIEKLGIFPSRQIEYRPRQHHLHRPLQALHPAAHRADISSPVGTILGSTPCAACAAWGTHRLPSAASGPRPGLPNAATTSTSPSSNTASAISSTRPRPGAWPCSTRSRSSLKTTQRTKVRC